MLRPRSLVWTRSPTTPTQGSQPGMRVSSCAALLSLAIPQSSVLSTRRLHTSAAMTTESASGFLAPPSPEDADVAFVLGPDEAAAMLRLRSHVLGEGRVMSSEPLSVDLGQRQTLMAIMPSGLALGTIDDPVRGQDPTELQTVCNRHSPTCHTRRNTAKHGGSVSAQGQ